jgi:WD40 repeat protein/tetratricopeptide (TPR) repeat protein
VLDREPDRPSAVRRGVDRDLETICLKCLEKDPARRYDSAAALADDLERWLRGEPIVARPCRGWERGLKWARRRPAVAALAAAVLLVAGAGLAGVLWQWGEAVRARRAESARAEGERQARRDAEEAWTAEKARADAEARAKREKQEALAEAEQNLYFQQVALAHQAWKAGKIPVMKEMLRRCPPKLRAWEWGYLWRLMHGDLATWQAPGPVRELAFRPGASQLAVVSGEGSDAVLLVEPFTGKVLRRLDVPAGRVADILFSPDGRLLAARCTEMPAEAWAPRDNAVLLFDCDTGELVRVLERGPTAIRALAFHPTGGQLALAGRAEQLEVRLRDVRTGRLLRTLRGSSEFKWVFSVHFRPGGKELAALADSTLTVWDLDTGEPRQPAARTTDKFSSDPFSRTMLPGREVFADSTAPEDRAVLALVPVSAALGFLQPGGQAWNVLGPVAAAETRIDRSEGEPEFSGQVFSPDGRWLIADGGMTAPIRDALTLKKQGRELELEGGITSLRVSPDGNWVVGCGSERAVGLWYLPSGRPWRTIRGHTAAVMAVAVHPGGRLVASATRGGEVKLWDATWRGEDNRVLHGGVEWLAQHGAVFRAGGEQVAQCLDSSMRTYSTRTGQVLSSVYVADSSSSLDRPLSPDGRYAIHNSALPAEGRDRYCRLLAKALPHLPADELKREVHFRELRVLDVASGKPVTALQEPVATGPHSFSSDGRLLAAAFLTGVKVWDVPAGKLRFRLDGHPALTSDVHLSPDGRWLVSAAGGRDSGPPPEGQRGVIKLWDLATGKPRWSIQSDRLSPLAFSPAGGELVTPGPGGGLQLRDLGSGKVRLTLPAQGDSKVVFRADGRVLASAGGARIRLWDVATGRLRHALLGPSRNVDDLAFSPDGRRLASTSEDDPFSVPEMKLWDVQTGWEVLTLSVRFRPDQPGSGNGRYAVILSGRGSVRFSPDGRRLLSGDDRLWDATAPTGQDQQARLQAWKEQAGDWHSSWAEEPDDDPPEPARHFSRNFHLSQLIRLRPREASLYARRARTYEALKQPDKALADYTRAIEPAPARARDWLRDRGVLYLGVFHEPRKALRDLDEAIRLGCDDASTICRRGEAWLKLGQPNKAALDFTFARSLPPRDGPSWAWCGEAHANLARWDQAERAFARAIALGPDMWSWRRRRLSVLLAAGRLGEYRKLLADSLARFRSDKDEETKEELALTCALIPGALDPLALLRLALPLGEEPNDPRSGPTDRARRKLLLGAALFRAGLARQALPPLRQAEQLRGKDATGVEALFLALSHHALGQKAEGRDALRRAVRLIDAAERAGKLGWQQRAHRRRLRQEAEALLR